MTFIPPQRVRVFRALVELLRTTEAEWDAAKSEREALSARVDALGRDQVTKAAQEAARLERVGFEKEAVAWGRYFSASRQLTRLVGELVE